jgi:hypothetical protein
MIPVKDLQPVHDFDTCDNTPVGAMLIASRRKTVYDVEVLQTHVIFL